MVLEIAKQRYKNRTGTEFNRFHWWEAVRYQPKWGTRSDAPSTIDAFVSSSEVGTEEEVTHPIGRDIAKTIVQKGKRNEDSSSQSRSSSVMANTMSTIKKLGNSFYYGADVEAV
jgi:hypothetical protein